MSSKLRTQIIFTQERDIEKIQIELKEHKKRIIVSNLEDDKPLGYYINHQKLIDIGKGNIDPKQFQQKNVKILDVITKPKTKSKAKLNN